MKYAFALIATAALASVTASPLPAQASERWPDIPPEVGTRQLRPVELIPYRCSDGPVYNFYHGALYSEPPAVLHGHAYRRHYRYTAWRVLPRTYFCSDE